jgi:hypothetical protein
MIRKLKQNMKKSYKLSNTEFFKLLKQLIEIESSLGQSSIYFGEWRYPSIPPKDKLEKFCNKYKLTFHSDEDYEDAFFNYTISWMV